MTVKIVYTIKGNKDKKTKTLKDDKAYDKWSEEMDEKYGDMGWSLIKYVKPVKIAKKK